ncbi:hypothetical protein M413DRAFT_166901 [Hebeloma cylindrosporum]|uniref:Uncharacterized protein n=1 Tax=Hebeloma cylindrosporum TaxID=76867 RepID=A0A0C3C937_HEBCY|nr:hypothetical protein M413DRAFT_166901 [Hebeloma cylindrosporum h7]
MGRVIVDDTDSGIRYTGPWFQANGQNDNLGNFGPPFQRTSHGVNEDATLSYTFTGTGVQVIGTSQVTPFGGATDPSWECFLDNVSIGSKPPISFAENNWVFCQADSLPDAQHNITLRATVRNQNTFWFDRIVYSPSPTMNLDSSLILIDANDPAVTYGPGWQLMRDIGTMTQQSGAKATVTFSGTSLKWFSLIPGDMPHASTSATYSVDGGTPVTFLLAGLADGAMEPYNQLFFEASGLTAGQHRIEVVHGGNRQTTPLSVNYLIIQNAPLPAGSTPISPPSISGLPPVSNSTGGATYNSLSPTGTVAGSTGTATPGSVSSSAERKGASTGAIVGGVVGGVIALIVVILLLLLLRRRRKRNVMDQELNQEKPSPPTIIQQFNVPTNTSISFPAGGQQPFYPQVHSGPGPGAQPEYILEYPSQSTVPTGPPMSHNSLYSYSQAPGSLPNHSTAANLTSQLLGSSKAKEAGELWQELPSHWQCGLPAASTSHSSSNATGKDAMRHEDCGRRLSPPEGTGELPPVYTLT